MYSYKNHEYSYLHISRKGMGAEWDTEDRVMIADCTSKVIASLTLMLLVANLGNIYKMLQKT